MGTRRNFLAGLLATGLPPKITWADTGNPGLLSAGLRPNGTYVLCGLSDWGDIVFEIPLPARGHAACAHPLFPHAVIFARRPETFALVINCQRGREIQRLHAQPGRHFYGHGIYSENGELLFTTENDYENARGVIGVWDTRDNYQRIGEFSSNGVGPHDIKLLPNQDVLVVANGGIETHPETGRSKLNISSMQSNLSYLSLDGTLQHKMTLKTALHKNSIRHLAIGKDGSVAFGMQWQGDPFENVPLVGVIDSERNYTLVDSTRDIIGRLKSYVGSIAMNDQYIAVTSPRGGVIQQYARNSFALSEETFLSDVCGLAPLKDGFIVTTGEGILQELQRDHHKKHNIRWDNHMLRI